MVKSSRDYIKRKLEQSQTHCNYIFQHLLFIYEKYAGGDYPEYLNTINEIINQVSDLDTMLKEFRKVC